MIRQTILTPAVVLVLWTLVMLIWLALVRFPAVKATPKESLRKLPRVGGRGQDLEGVIDPKAQWPAHNYAHLHEQPTLFYAVVAILALTGQGVGLNTTLAWAYVAIRIVHSIWQSTVNTLPVRFGLFILSSLVLVALAINALRATL
ncbi:MAG TPA: MAPEG family protein [Hyphomicrobiaceae bacterium]|nr:MAPEG family protein [Hyphomicrobiaceae bacterium]